MTVREWFRSAASTASRQWLGKSPNGMPYLLGTLGRYQANSARLKAAEHRVRR